MNPLPNRPDSADIYRPPTQILNRDNDYLIRMGLIIIIRGSPSQNTPRLIAQRMAAEHGGRQQDYTITQASIAPFLISCPSTRIRDQIVQRGTYYIPSERIHFMVHEWRPRFGMGHDPCTHQVWVQMTGLPLQAWTLPEISTILQDFGHPIHILPFGREAGHFRHITALVETKNPSSIPLAFYLREGNYSARVEIEILSWRPSQPGYFPPPEPSSDEPGQPTPQQQSNRYYNQYHGSPSSSPNDVPYGGVPSEPTIDLSAWSPRSHAMTSYPSQLPPPFDFLAAGSPQLTLSSGLLAVDPEFSPITRHPLSLSSLNPIRIPSTTTHSAACSILAIADRDSILLLSASCYNSATDNLNCLGNLAHVLPLARITPLNPHSPIVITPSNPPQTPIYTSVDSRDNPIAPSLQILSRSQYGEGTDGSLPLYSAERTRCESSLVFNWFTHDLSSQAGHTAQQSLTWAREIAIPLAGLEVAPLHRCKGKNLQLSPQLVEPDLSQPTQLRSLLQASSSQQQPQSDQRESNCPISQLMPTQHTQNCSVQDTDDSSCPRSFQGRSQQQSHPSLTPHKSKTMATRRSERLLQKKSNLTTSTHRPLKNKAKKGKIAFDIDSVSHSTPLDVSTVLQILQATGMQISEQTEQLVQDAIDQDLHSQHIDPPMPTTPLQDVIPPLAIPGDEMML